MTIQETKNIQYVSGYEYQLRKDSLFFTQVKPRIDIDTDLISLNTKGQLVIRKYFAWDGPSGPTWDDRTNMRASLVHDAFYVLMRMGLLHEGYRKIADEELGRYMIMDGAWPFRAWYYTKAVDWFASSCADKKNKRKILIAPGVV